MADFGIGIGSFLSGLGSGMKMRQAMDDREWQSKARARQEKEWSEAEEDRASNKDWQGKARARQEQEWKNADEDRASNKAWTDETHAETKNQWARAKTIYDRQEQAAQRDDEIRAEAASGMEAAKAQREQAVTKSVIQSPVQGPGRDGEALPDQYRVGEAMYKTPEDARKAADKQTASVLDYYRREHAPKVVEKLRAQNKLDEANAYEKWIDSEATQEGQKHWANAVIAARAEDAQGVADNLIKAYNAKGYFDNGYTATGKMRTDDGGNITGVDIDITNDQTGQKHSTFLDNETLFKRGLDFMSPESVMKQGMEQIDAVNKARQQQAAKEADMRRDIQKKVIEKQIAQGNPDILKRLESAQRRITTTTAGISMTPDQLSEAAKELVIKDDEMAEAYRQQQAAPSAAKSVTQSVPNSQTPPAKTPPLWKNSGR